MFWSLSLCRFCFLSLRKKSSFVWRKSQSCKQFGCNKLIFCQIFLSFIVCGISEWAFSVECVCFCHIRGRRGRRLGRYVRVKNEQRDRQTKRHTHTHIHYSRKCSNVRISTSDRTSHLLTSVVENCYLSMKPASDYYLRHLKTRRH